MPRKSKDSVQIMTRINKGKKEELGKRVIAMGYTYTKSSEVLPAWGEWLEAIADGELQLFKKVP